MTILTCKPLSPPIWGIAKGKLAMLSLFVAVIIAAAADSPFALAESAPPVVPTTQLAPHSSKPPNTVAKPPQNSKKPAVKANPRPRVAPKVLKPAPAAKSSTVPAAKPTQVMDFDADQVEGQRLEPGYDLIQASPPRARHRSMVSFPPKPEDSVVKGN